jgi:hypothetical protein
VALDALADLPPNLDDSITGTPPRRRGSVRRTATIDMVWPGGFGTPLHLVGRARDLVTPARGDPVVADAAEMLVTIADNRTVASVETVPARAGIEGLVGTQGGSYLRAAIDEVLPGERDAATPLHLLLDDVAGTSLIAGYAWSRWRDDMRRLMSRGGDHPSEFGVRKGRIICSGLRPDGWAQTARERGDAHPHASRLAGDIASPDDPLAWHEMPERPPVCMRRHRRIDVQPADGALVVDAFFRDSCWEPDGTEMALHEYTVDAVVDASSLTLRSVRARPRVLPFPECQWAAPNVAVLEGMPVATFRTSVQETLTELQCCTHLNDMLRCLAEVPALAQHLDHRSARSNADDVTR